MSRQPTDLLNTANSSMDENNIESFDTPQQVRARREALTSDDSRYDVNNLRKFRGAVPRNIDMGVPLNKYTEGMPSNQRDYEQYMAQQQSFGDKAKHGLIKLFGNTALTVAGGTYGALAGLGAAVQAGDFTKIFDNDTQAALDSARESLREMFPHYYQQSERFSDNPVRGIIPGTPGSANMWFDKIFDGASFTIGAALTEMIWATTTGGIGNALKAMTVPARLAKIAQTTRYLNKLSYGSKAGAIGRRLNSPVAATANFGRGALRLSRQLGTSAMYEAGVESRAHMEMLRDELTQKAIAQYGENLPDWVIDDIESIVRSSGIGVFSANTALVGAGHIIQFPKLFGLNFGKMRKGIPHRDVIRGAGNTWLSRFEQLSKGEKVARNIGLVLKNPIYEGFVEEGGQKVADETLRNYWTKRYDPEGGREVSSIIRSGLNAMETTYATKEGLEEVAIGFVIGALGIPGVGGGVVGSLQQDQARQRRALKLAQAANANPTMGEALRRNAEASRKQVANQREIDSYLNQDDIFNFENAKHDAVYAYVTLRNDLGYFTEVIENAEAMRNLEVEDFMKETGMDQKDPITKVEQLEIIDSFINKAKSIKKAQETVDSVYNGENDNIRDILTYILATSDNIDKRESDLSKEIYDLTNGKVNHDSIKQFPERSEQLEISRIDKELQSADLTPEYKVRLKAQRKILENKMEEINLEGEMKYYTTEAFNAYRDWFVESFPVPANVNEKVLRGLVDLAKLKAKRHSYIDYYNSLFTPQGQAKLQANIEAFKSEVIRLMDQEGAPADINTQDPSIVPEARTDADQGIISTEKTDVSKSKSEAKRSEIESKVSKNDTVPQYGEHRPNITYKDEETGINRVKAVALKTSSSLVQIGNKEYRANSELYEDGTVIFNLSEVDKHGSVIAQPLTKEQYYSLLASLDKEDTALEKESKKKQAETKKELFGKTNEELSQEANQVETDEAAAKEYIDNYRNAELSEAPLTDLFDGGFEIYAASSIDKETGATVFGVLKLDENNNVFFIHKNGRSLLGTLGGLNQEMSPSFFNVTVLLDSILTTDISKTGDIVNINGVTLYNDYINRLDAIKEDKDGNPISITLLDADENRVVIKDNRLVNELATQIAIYEEAFFNTLEKVIKESGDEFVVVTHPDTGKLYNVYYKGGTFVVVNPANNKTIKGSAADRVITRLRSDVGQAMESALEALKTSEKAPSDKTLGKLKKEIKDELERLNLLTRSATTRESLDAAPESQVLTPEEAERTKNKQNQRSSEEEAGEATDQGTTDVEAQRDTIDTGYIDTFINFVKDKTQSISLLRNEAKRNWDGTDVITGERIQIFYSSIKMLVHEFSEFADLLDRFITNTDGNVGITNNNLTYIINTLNKEGINSQFDIGDKINAKYDAELTALESGKSAEQTIKDNVTEDVTNKKLIEEQETEQNDYTEESGDELDSYELLDDSEIEQDPRLAENDRKNYKNGQRGLEDTSTALAYSPDENKDIDDYLTDPNNDLSNAYVSFELTDETFNNKTLNDFYKANPDIKEAIANNQPLSEAQLAKVIELADADLFSNVLDIMPIKAILRDKTTSKPLTGTFYYHQSNYKNIKLPDNIARLRESPNKMQQVQEYERAQKEKVRQMRLAILNALLTGKDVRIDNVRKTKGHIVNAPKNDANRNRNILDVFGIKSEDVILAIANSNEVLFGTTTNRAIQGDLDTMRGVSGAIYLYTHRTANGEAATVQLNPSKVSPVLGSVILSAFEQAYRKGGGFQTTIKHPAVKGNLTIGQFLRAFVHYGEKDTRVEAGSHRSYKLPNHLLNKQLYVTDAKILHYGESSELNLHDYNEQDVNNFINWATANKNLVFRKDDALGNNKFNFDATIAGYTIRKGQSYMDFVLREGIVKTDIIAPFFKSPTVVWDGVNTAITITDRAIAPTAAEKTVDPVTKVEVTSEGVKEAPVENLPPKGRVFNADMLARLPEGTSLYTTSEYLDDYGNTTEVKKSYKGVIKRDADGDLIILTPDTAKELRTTLTNKQGLQRFFDSIYDPSGLQYETLAKKREGAPKSVQEIISRSKYNPFARAAKIPRGKYKKADVRRELEWFRDVIGPKEFVKVEKDLIQLAKNGIEAFGVFSRDSIRLYEAAEEGTLYHESYHRVSLMMLSPAQRQLVYDQAAKEGNLDRNDTRAIEEYLAEKFRNWKLAKVNKQPTGIKGAIQSFFNRLYNIARALYYRFFGGNQLNDLTIERLFNAIDTGYFRHRKPNNESLKELSDTNYYHTIDGFTSQEIRSWVKNLTFMLIVENGVDSLADVQHIRYKPVLNELVAMRDQFQELAADSDIREEIDYSNNLANIYSNVINKFDDFVSITRDYLRILNIKQTDIHPDELSDMFNTIEEQDEFQKYDINSFQVSSKDNVHAQVKFTIAMLPASDVPSAYNGLHEFVDFGSAWSDIMRNLHDSMNITEMLERIDSLAVGNIMYETLANKLRGNQNLQTQFEVSIRKSFNNYINLLIDYVKDKYSYEIVRADIQKAANRIHREWGQSLIQGPLFKDGKVDTEYAKLVREEYGKVFGEVTAQYKKTHTFSDIDTVKEGIIKVYKMASVPLDMKTLDELLNSMVGTVNQHEALHKFVTKDSARVFGTNGLFQTLADGGTPLNSKGETILPNRYLTNEGVVRNVAENYVKARPSEVEPSVLGPDGATYFAYSPYTYLAYSKQEMKSTDLANQLAGTIFSRDSYILKQLLTLDGDGKLSTMDGFDINIFAGIYQKRKADKGDEYFKMNPLEDYMLRLQSTLNNVLPLPTLGDRGFLPMLQGIKRIPFELVERNGKWVIPDDSPVYDVMLRYLETEHTLVEKAKQDIIKAEQEQEYSDEYNLGHQPFAKLKRYYHFDYDANGDIITRNKDGKFIGNGTRYRHFSDFNNEYKYDPSKNRQHIKDIVRQRIIEEILHAESLGLIELKRTESGTITNATNKYLDGSFIKINEEGKKIRLLEDKYGTDNQFAAIRDVLGDYVVNSMMMTIETEKLFLMDPAYYKNVGDKEKRITILGGSGDLMRTNFPLSHELYGKHTYNVATLRTQKYASIYTKSIQDKLKELYVKDGIKAEDAERMAKARSKEYLDVDPTDGQMFITPELHRSISMRLGEWSPDIEEAYRLLESDEELSVRQELKLMNLVMQPLKTVYFGKEFTSDGMAAPVYDKMAMGVLFKRFAGENSELSFLIDTMKAQGTDAIKYDTVVKVGEDIKSDLYTDINSGELNSKLVLHNKPQDFKYLFRQQVTPTKRELERLTGTQFIKVVMANHANESTRHEMNVLISQLSDLNKDKFFKELSINETNENGAHRIEFGNLEELANMLREDAILSQASNNVFDALKIEDGKFVIELDALPDNKWIHNRLISKIGKNTVDLNLPGGSAVQVSSLGLRGGVFGENNLKFIRSEDGKIKSSEAMMSTAMFRKVIPGYNKMSHEQRVSFLKSNPQVIAYRIPTQGYNSVMSLSIKEFLPDYYGDVIFLPYEVTKLTGSDFDIDKQFYITYNYERIDIKSREYAIEYNLDGQEGLRKVPYLTESNSTVLERAEKYAELLAESDLKDLNRYYAMRIRQTLTVIDATQDVIDRINDELGDIYSTIEDVFNEDAVEKRALKHASYDKVADVFDLIKDKKDLYSNLDRIKELRNVDARAVVKQHFESIDQSEFANRPIEQQNTKKAIQNKIVSLIEKTMASEEIFTQSVTPLDVFVDRLKSIAQMVDDKSGHSKREKSLQLTVPSYQQLVKQRNVDSSGGIAPFALNNVNHTFAQIARLHLEHPLGEGEWFNKSVNGGTSLYHSKGRDGEYITDWYSAVISAFVDAAKDNYISRMNINAQTYNATNLLLRAGVGEATFYFMAQPAIKEAANILNSKDGRITDYSGFDIKTVRGILNDRLVEAAKAANVKSEDIGKYINEFKPKMFSRTALKKDIGLTEGDWKFHARQMAIFDKFRQLRKIGYELNNIVQLSQIDTKKYGINFSEIRSFLDRLYNELEESSFEGFSEMLTESFLQTKLENGPVLLTQLVRNRFITATDAFGEAHDKVLELLKQRLTSTKAIINQTSNELFTSFAMNFVTDPMGLALQSTDINELFLGDNTIASRLHAIKTDPKYSDIADKKIIKMIMTYFREVENDPDLIMSFNTAVREKWDKDDAIRSWEDLLASNDPVIRKLGEDLVTYAMLTSGLQKNIYSFYQYIPVNYLKEIGYSAYISENLAKFNTPEGSVIMDSFIHEMFINSWYNTNIVPNLSVAERVSPLAPTGTPYSIITKLKPLKDHYIGENSEGEPVFRPYVTFEIGNNIILYKYIGYDSKTYEPVYKAIDKKSYRVGNLTIREHGIDQSAFQQNILPRKITDENHEKIPLAGDYANFVEVTNIDIAEYGKATIFDSTEKNVVMLDAPVSINGNDSKTGEFIRQIDGLQDGTISAITSRKKMGEVGDVVQFLDAFGEPRPGKFVITKVDEINDVRANDEQWVEEWSEQTGFSVKHFRDNYGTPFLRDGSYNTVFEMLNNEGKVVKKEVTPNIDTSTTINVYAGDRAGGNLILSNLAFRQFNISFVNDSILELVGLNELSESLESIMKDTDKPFVGLFNSVEQLFQVSKYLYSEDSSENREVVRKIMSTNKTGEIKKLGREFSLENKNEFDKVAYEIMRFGIYESFNSVLNTEANAALMDTGDALITHTQDNTRWKEEFPKALMDVRHRLRNNLPLFDSVEDVSPFLSELGVRKVQLIPTGYDYLLEYNELIEKAQDDSVSVEQFKEILSKVKKVDERVSDGVSQIESGAFDMVLEARGLSRKEIIGELRLARTHDDLARILEKIC